MSVTATDAPRQEQRLAASDVWVPAMEGVRGYLGLTIALTHVVLAVGWSAGAEGLDALRVSAFLAIDCLFLIGGFVAFLPIAVLGRFRSVRVYAVRRAARILPVYYLTIAIAVILGDPLREVTLTNFPHDAGAVLAHLAFLQHVVLPYEEGFGIQGIVWTMTIAVTFYLLFPLVARAWLRHPFRWLAGVLVLSLVWREATRGNDELYLQFPVFASDFAFGMTGAYVLVRLRRGEVPDLVRRAAPRLSLVAAPVLLVLAYLAGVPVVRDGVDPWREATWLSVAVPLAFTAFLVALADAPGWLQRVAGNPLIRWLGSISYAFFLLHFLVIWSVLALVDIPRDGSLTSLLALTALVLPVTATLAWAVTRFVEDPIRARAKRWRPSGARVRSAPATQPS